MSGQLERLLAEATPPRRSIKSFAARMELADFIEDNGPEMARLLVDAMAWIDPILTKPYRVEELWKEGNELLARFAELEQRAGEGQA